MLLAFNSEISISKSLLTNNYTLPPLVYIYTKKKRLFRLEVKFNFYPKKEKKRSEHNYNMRG